jgi:probable F420-dependent oxidoreductase
MDLAAERAALRETLGSVGVWSFTFEAVSAAAARDGVAELERQGWPVLWVPESVGSKEVFSHTSLLLSGGTRIAVASGIANIWARDPVAMANGARTVADAFPGRFVLGIGVSHEPSVQTRGGRYVKPLEHMAWYLDGMDGARFDGPEPERPAPRLLAALGPKMLGLAAERATGAHPYFVPPEHTAFARGVLGPEPVLAVELTAALGDGASPVLRDWAAGYLGLPNYYNSLRRMGFSEGDLAEGGNDRMHAAVFGIGTVDSVVAKVREHLDAGADHVCVQLIGADESDLHLGEYAELAEAVLPGEVPG